ncbi:MAG: hypothetical protein CBD16_08065 [Betaproteobacteria bacterium TMED156]|nr:MAG: hypothetical protein CBD16_08065 [Betaproteobacteria bacterium TMED156]|tara:strand:- start:1465 stop:1890 length:426 start_codon:yes stop_codon:yes gene_type:complete
MDSKNFIMVNNSLVFKVVCFFLYFVLSITYVPSYAWELIASGGNFKEYFKGAARTGRTASILAMRDYKSEMSQGNVDYLSVKKLYQFECSKGKYRLMLVEKYEKNKLQGELIYSSKTYTSWLQVSPNTLNELALKKACKKK